MKSEVLEGLVLPWRDLQLGMSVDGLLDEVYVDRGDFIKAGELIASLEASVEEVNLEIAQGRVEHSQSRADRDKQLSEQGEVTKEELDQIIAEQELAVLGEKMAAATLRRMTVESPVDGVVVERFLSPGELVSRATAGVLVRVAQVDPLKVDVIAPLELFGKIKVGDTALVRPEDPVGGVFEAEVKVADPLLAPASGTFRIRLSLPNPEGQIPSGVRCQVEFQM